MLPTCEEFVESSMADLEPTFNSGRPDKKKVKGKRNKKKVRKGLKLGYEKRVAGKDPETIRTELKKEMFGGLVATLVSVFLPMLMELWGDDIIAWIIKKLIPLDVPIKD